MWRLARTAVYGACRVAARIIINTISKIAQKCEPMRMIIVVGTHAKIKNAITHSATDMELGQMIMSACWWYRTGGVLFVEG